MKLNMTFGDIKILLTLLAILAAIISLIILFGNLLFDIYVPMGTYVAMVTICIMVFFRLALELRKEGMGGGIVGSFGLWMTIITIIVVAPSHQQMFSYLGL